MSKLKHRPQEWQKLDKCKDCGKPICKSRCPSGRCYECSTRHTGKYHKRKYKDKERE